MTGQYYKSKRILLTGASSGIGKGVALALGQIDCTLILTGRSKERLHAVGTKCTKASVHYVLGDLTRENTIIKLKETIVSAGGLDVAILNAGVSIHVDALNFDASIFKNTMDQNYNSMVDCIEATLPRLLESKGQLALMASIAGYGGLPGASAYCASKSAIRTMAQSLDQDLRKHGVPVTCICPGFVKTPLTDKNEFYMPFRLTPEKAAKAILKGIQNKQHEVYFPRIFSWILKLVTSLPASWGYAVLSRLK